MEEVLQRLLKAESAAEAIAKEADAERERLVEDAKAEAVTAEQRFQERLPDIRASLLDKAEANAQQTLTELKRRYEERHADLRAIASEHEREAVEAVLAILLDPKRC
ncbi:MAG: ATPase [Chromatiales bacterium]|jgi:vacuolar-type H+-ATPase subunit H